MSGIAMLALAAGLAMVELELREVEQIVVAPGSLSTAQARIRPVGQVLRVAPGGVAQWHLAFSPAGVPAVAPALAVRLQRPSAPGQPPRATPEAVLLQGDAAGSRWELSARLLSLEGGDARLALRWMREHHGEGGSTQVEQRFRLEHWTVVARKRPGSAPPPGTVSTRPVAEVKELQMRVRPVLE
jgi:hypothetical protein